MKVSTKPSKDGIAKDTIVNITWDSPSAERALATQALIVKLQGGWRKNGIPDKVDVKVSDYAPGTRHAPTLQESIAALSPAERAALIAQLTK